MCTTGKGLTNNNKNVHPSFFKKLLTFYECFYCIVLCEYMAQWKMYLREIKVFKEIINDIEKSEYKRWKKDDFDLHGNCVIQIY